MSPLPKSIPRATEVEQIYEEPFGFLARTRSALGDIFVLREHEPLFSRSPDCAGAIAVFGARHHQAVLSDIDLFGMPVSAAQDLSLPQNLVNLNRGLHSMRGEQHDQHHRLLMRVLSERSIEGRRDAINATLETFVQGWHTGQQFGLLNEMRRLTLEVSTGFLFGERYLQSGSLAALAERYFHFRRAVASTFTSPSETTRSELVALGTSLDDAMRRHTGWARQESAGSSDGLLAKLARLEVRPGTVLSEDEMVAHGNVLFMSSIEPIAVALTWTLLILSQLPDLRRELRHELDQVLSGAVPSTGALSGLSLLDSVINESLRLLTPNALMVRLTTRAGFLNGVPLPEGCEVLLCPFLAHRDAEQFPRPNEFLPSRWQRTRPSPFEYFPFGAGGHYCVGRALAIHIIKATMAVLMQRHDLILSSDQEIDWHVDIVLLPEDDPIMTVQLPGAKHVKAGKLLGSVSDLIRL